MDIVGGEVAVEEVSAFGVPCWKLTPTAKYGFQFEGFQGNGTWVGLSYYVLKIGCQSVTATFKLIPSCKVLTVDIHGSGSVSTSPAGVTIGDKKYFEKDDWVTLTPTAGTGWEFDKWEGTTNGNKVKMCTDQEVDAYFKRCVYDITFEIGAHGEWSDDTTDPKIVKTEYEAVPIAPGYDANTGYYFTGWSPDLVGAAGPATYTATWAPISYTVTYDKTTGDGGSTADSAHTYDVASTLTENGFYKDGYTFEGWTDSPEGASVQYTDQQSVLNLTSVDDDVVEMYAIWKIKTFSVSFYQQDGTTQIGQTQTVNWNTAATLETAPAVTGYTFDKWILTGEDPTQPDSLTNVKENLKAVASYTRNSYLVTFLDSQGKVIGTQTVLYGDPATALAAPVVTGYTFTGWDKDYSKIVSDLTVTAQYKINVYTVKFVDFDGKVLSTQSVNYGSPATAPANPSREGYAFTGWDKDYSKIASDLTVTAQYKINAYTVKFVDFDGKVLSTQSVNWGAAAVAPANPARSGYTFTSWDKDYSKITSDLTVTAQYKQNVSSDDEDIPGTYDSGSQPFPWLWIAVAAVLAGSIVVIVVSQARRHKKTGDAV